MHENHYEESLDWNLNKLLPEGQRIEKVSAFPITKPRIIGDIGLRAFFQLRKKALDLVKKEKIDFVYIPIPSFYVSLIGSYLHRKTGVKYGIDYIDPWVHTFPGTEKHLSRHWFSTKLAKLLEPQAVKYASLITGVAEGYYKDVKIRNPHLQKSCIFGAMPYGGESMDHEIVSKLNLSPYLFKMNEKIQLVYAGAMLPKAYGPLEQIFRSIAHNISDFENVEFHFIGTGSKPTDPTGFTIKPLAVKYGLWKKNIFEYPLRIPYLDVLVHLESASGVFILGSTEPHYSPSKVYQSVLSQKPVFAVLHRKSTAVQVIEKSAAGVVLSFEGENEIGSITDQFPGMMMRFKCLINQFKPDSVNRYVLEAYSARSATQKLVGLISSVL